MFVCFQQDASSWRLATGIFLETRGVYQNSDGIPGAECGHDSQLDWDRLVERLIRFGSRKWTKTAGLCGLALVFAIAGYDSYIRDGLPNRVRDFSGVYGPGREHGYIETVECQKDIGKDYAGICLSEGSPLKKRVAVIGDSHGLVLFSGVDNANNVILGGYAVPALRGVGSKSSLQSNIDLALDFLLAKSKILYKNTVIGF
jgi:hypothetical protein